MKAKLPFRDGPSPREEAYLFSRKKNSLPINLNRAWKEEVSGKPTPWLWQQQSTLSSSQKAANKSEEFKQMKLSSLPTDTRADYSEGHLFKPSPRKAILFKKYEGSPITVDALIAQESIKLIKPSDVLSKHLASTEGKSLKFKIALVDNVILASQKISDNNLSVKKNFEVINDFYSKLKKKVKKKRRMTALATQNGKTIDPSPKSGSNSGRDPPPENLPAVRASMREPTQRPLVLDLPESPVNEHKVILADRLKAENRFTLQVKMLMKKMNEDKLKKKTTCIVEEDSNQSSEDSLLGKMNQKAEVYRIKDQIKAIEIQNKLKEEEELKNAGKRNLMTFDEKGPTNLKKVFNLKETKSAKVDIPTLRDLNRQAQKEIKSQLEAFTIKVRSEKKFEVSSLPQLSLGEKFNSLEKKESASHPYSIVRQQSHTSMSLESRRKSALREVLAFLLNEKLDEDTVGTHKESIAQRKFRIKRKTQNLLLTELDKVIDKNKKLKSLEDFEVSQEGAEDEQHSANSDESSKSAKDNLLSEKYQKLKILNSYLEIIDEKYDKNLNKFRGKVQDWIDELNQQVDRILDKKIDDAF